jgi:phage replication-related protein YjqB (UPF0714/DUF867 family)
MRGERVQPRCKNSRMADRYRNFADLAAHEKEDLDFRIRSDERHGQAAVIAPHGGGIEPGTSELGEAIAGDDLSFYSFDGLKKRGNGVFHITSSRFDEPNALALVAASPAVVAMHGELDCPDQVAFLGGLDKELGKRIQAGLEEAGFVVRIHHDPKLQGVDKNNICNRGRSKATGSLMPCVTQFSEATLARRPRRTRLMTVKPLAPPPNLVLFSAFLRHGGFAGRL